MPFIKNVAIFAKKGGSTQSTGSPEIGPFIAANQDNTLLISPTGSIIGWGNFGSAQIGNTSFNFSCRCTPVSIGGAKKTFCKIALGQYGGHGIDKSGGLWGWGYNYQGAVGDGTGTFNYTQTPAKIGTRTFCNIAAGRVQGGFSVAIDKNGKAWSWGYNPYGNLGTGNVTNVCVPTSVYGTKTFCRVAAGQYHGAALDKNGKAWCWGWNQYGQIGVPPATGSVMTPIAVQGATKTFCEIFCSDYATMAIDKNGKVWGWGYGYNGVFGNNGSNAYSTPVAVAGAAKTFCKLSTSTYVTLAIDKDGKAWCWGYNSDGQMGSAVVARQNVAYTPVSVYGTKTFCHISVSNRHSAGIDKNNNIWSWGNDEIGQLGISGSYDVTTPVSMKATNKTFCSITNGIGSTPAVLDKNKVIFGWGSGPAPGDGSTSRRVSPVSAYNPLNLLFNGLATGNDYGLGLATDGTVYGWGYPNYGVTGHGNYTYYPYYSVTKMATFCRIAAGNYHALAIDNNGKLWSWGANWYGQLGQNIAPDYNARSIPGSVYGTSTKTFCQIAGGSDGSSLAIDKNGKVWGWGNNVYGQLGNNTSGGASSFITPVSVCGQTKTFCRITMGGNHALAIDKNGKGWAWGYSGPGVLGNNSQYVTFTTPIAICGNKTFCRIDTGFQHSAAIDNNGKVWVWGDNSRGQFGNNTKTGNITPVSIYGTKTFCQIGCGDYFTYGIDNNGKLWGWGNWNYLDKNPIFLTPVRVYKL